MLLKTKPRYLIVLIFHLQLIRDKYRERNKLNKDYILHHNQILLINI